MINTIHTQSSFLQLMRTEFQFVFPGAVGGPRRIATATISTSGSVIFDPLQFNMKKAFWNSIKHITSQLDFGDCCCRHPVGSLVPMVCANLCM